MTAFRNRMIDHIAKSLKYVPIAIILFLALLSWREGFAKTAVICGIVGIGLILLNILTHKSRVTGNARRFVAPACFIFITAIGVYALIDMNVYMGIFYVLIGMSLICDRLLKGKWKQICCTAATGLAVVALVFYILEVTNGLTKITCC